MKFRQFIEMVREEPVETQESTGILTVINDRLDKDLGDLFMSPETGIQKVRQILSTYGMDLPAIYGLDQEGDEFTIQMNDTTYLYVVYAQTDNGLYDFYAELTDEEGLEEILEDEEDEDEE